MDAFAMLFQPFHPTAMPNDFLRFIQLLAAQNRLRDCSASFFLCRTNERIRVRVKLPDFTRQLFKLVRLIGGNIEPLRFFLRGRFHFGLFLKFQPCPIWNWFLNLNCLENSDVSSLKTALCSFNESATSLSERFCFPSAEKSSGHITHAIATTRRAMMADGFAVFRFRNVGATAHPNNAKSDLRWRGKSPAVSSTSSPLSSVVASPSRRSRSPQSKSSWPWPSYCSFSSSIDGCRLCLPHAF